MRIAVVEDNRPLADGLAKSFRADGHGVDVLYDGSAAETFLLAESFDLIILDINLPGKSGLQVLTSLRRNQVPTPVLLLTARADLSDKVSGLDLGADDYLEKPFDLPELKARARALLRRSEKQLKHVIFVGRLMFDQDARLVSIDNEILDLPRREFALMEILIANKDRIISKHQILDHLYGLGSEVDETTVELYVHRLRKRIGDSGVEIKTARGLGYCLRQIR
ncbi:MAG: two-component system OmpR family response regulator [Granulosicoccus sp.]|jgi:two-component system OmpR family response regulator